MFVLAHLSDAHLNPLPPFGWPALLNKRITGYANWLKSRRRLHDMAVLDAVIADIAAHAPDHVAMTGDVAHIGLPEEFSAAAAFLDRLGPRERVSFVPGNHDAYVPESLPACLARLAPWARGNEGAGFPWIRRQGRVALIGLSSAVPTPPLIARGAIGTAQFARAGALLEQAKAEGLARVVLVHHAPHVGGSKPSKCLIDAGEFEAMLARAGAELVLHGHTHRTSVALRPGPGGTAVPIVGVPSASEPHAGGHEPGGWHLIRIDADGATPRIRIERRRIGPDGAMIDAGPLDLGQTFG